MTLSTGCNSRSPATHSFVEIWGNNPIADEKQARLNDEITVPEVRLIDQEGEQQGVVSIAQAMEAAEQVGLDLVEIVPNANPPVCRLMDYGKYKFQQKKKLHEQRKKQRQVHIKEIKFRPGTEEGDYQVKLKKLVQFIEAGDRAKVTVRFRGREMAHQELGMELMNKVKEDFSESIKVELQPKMEGRQMVMVLAPKKK